MKFNVVFVAALFASIASLANAHVRLEFLETGSTADFKIRNSVPNTDDYPNGVWSWGGACGGSPHDGPRTEPRAWGAIYENPAEIPVVKPKQKLDFQVNLGFKRPPTHVVDSYEWTAAMKCGAPEEENVFKQSKAYDIPGMVTVPANLGRQDGGYAVSFYVPEAGTMTAGEKGNRCTISILLEKQRYGGCVDVYLACADGQFWAGDKCQECEVCGDNYAELEPKAKCDGTEMKNRKCEVACDEPATKVCPNGEVVTRWQTPGPTGYPTCSFKECKKPTCGNGKSGQPFECPNNSTPKPNPDSIQCANICASSVCCNPPLESCGKYKCSLASMYLNPAKFTEPCAMDPDLATGPICSDATCCMPPGVCADTVCRTAIGTLGLSENSPFALKLRTQASQEDLVCGDILCEPNECCEVPLSCGDFQCLGERQIIPNALGRACAAEKCTKEECCEEVFVCAQHECPANMHLKDGAETIKCSAVTCIQRDFCCEDNITCDSYEDHCIEADLYPVLNSNTVPCNRHIHESGFGETMCSEIECCKQQKQETTIDPGELQPSSDEEDSTIAGLSPGVFFAVFLILGLTLIGGGAYFVRAKRMENDAFPEARSSMYNAQHTGGGNQAFA